MVNLMESKFLLKNKIQIHLQQIIPFQFQLLLNHILHYIPYITLYTTISSYKNISCTFFKKFYTLKSSQFTANKSFLKSANCAMQRFQFFYKKCMKFSTDKLSGTSNFLTRKRKWVLVVQTPSIVLQYQTTQIYILYIKRQFSNIIRKKYILNRHQFQNQQWTVPAFLHNKKCIKKEKLKSVKTQQYPKLPIHS
eukprot:TRINITY_DN5090_c1_g1_i2.p2 TRINITY_DN5090_c1_g1~~TRINITY_DN5090_c1_g1_i2.p2  ORF type:complete len:194 (+),score=-21.11 TRINITY_DN5090_c1_g1_i2:256-837(+)